MVSKPWLPVQVRRDKKCLPSFKLRQNLISSLRGRQENHPVHLFEVVGAAGEIPSTFSRFVAPKQELAETHNTLYDPYDRLDTSLALPVEKAIDKSCSLRIFSKND